MRALPPFDGLIAFDAALRHRSMTLAAGELGLTQSAISHRLKRLEAFVGAPLLNRTAAGLLPTPAGMTLAEGLGRMLDEMAELRARSRATVQPATLKIGLGSALADYWLVRRLPAFASAHPDVAVELFIIESDVQARALDLDVQIRWLPKASARATSTQRLLFDEMVFPVAIPSLLPRERPLRIPACSAPCRSCTRVTLAGTTARSGRGRSGSSGSGSRLPLRPGFASTISVRQSLLPCRAAVSLWAGHCWFTMLSQSDDFAASCRQAGIWRPARHILSVGPRRSPTTSESHCSSPGLQRRRRKLLFDEGAPPPTSGG
jgi:DNA-binding transcriptional LysR family regulator